jgi:thiol-disulfide isomerase/thioredoxin
MINTVVFLLYNFIMSTTTTTQPKMHSSKMKNSLFLPLATVMSLCHILLLPTTDAFQFAHPTGSVRRQQGTSSSLNYASSSSFPQPSPAGASSPAAPPSLHDLLSKAVAAPTTTVPSWAAAAAAKTRGDASDNDDLASVIREVNTLEDFKKMVQDNAIAAMRVQRQPAANQQQQQLPLMVVRFHATYCAACKRAAPSFHRLVRKHVTSPSSSSSVSMSNTANNAAIQFVDVAVSKHNIDLQRHVGLKSIPSAFLYHYEAGLVEQLSINKGKLHHFQETLESYIEGSCRVTYTAEGDIIRY